MKVKVIDGVHLIASQTTIDALQTPVPLRNKKVEKLLKLAPFDAAMNKIAKKILADGISYIGVKFAPKEHYKFNTIGDAIND